MKDYLIKCTYKGDVGSVEPTSYKLTIPLPSSNLHIQLLIFTHVLLSEFATSSIAIARITIVRPVVILSEGKCYEL